MSEVAGKLTERVALSAATFADDGAGGQIPTWAPLDPPEVYAAIDGLRGTERMAAAAVEVTLAYRVRLRYHPGIDAHTRIDWNGRVLEVIGPPVELQRRAVLELYCAERGQ